MDAEWVQNGQRQPSTCFEGRQLLVSDSSTRWMDLLDVHDRAAPLCDVSRMHTALQAATLSKSTTCVSELNEGDFRNTDSLALLGYCIAFEGTRIIVQIYPGRIMTDIFKTHCYYVLYLTDSTRKSLR
jgi:hypothetical protein